jgi:hypothetical protein
MRKSVSILLCLLLLLNAMGYYGLLVGIRYRASSNLATRLDQENYHQDETITLKVPLAVPYYSDDADFKRVNGQIEHNGQVFSLVKQKLSRDTLYIVCIRDHESQKIKQALADYVKTFTDHPIDTKSSQGKIFQTFIKDFLFAEKTTHASKYGWCAVVRYCTFDETASSEVIAISTPPPRA